MRILMHIVLTLLLTGRVTFTEAQTWQEAKDELSFGVFDVSGGAESIRPVTNLNSTLTVNLDMNIASINNFDDTNGYMDISGYLNVEWTSEVLGSSAFDITELVAHNRMWKPPILFVNALKQSEEIGSDSETKIRYNFKTLQCTWQPWFILRGACSPDVKYYPYDKQECSFSFAAWGYRSSEVIFRPQNSEVGFVFFEENGSWEVEGSFATSTVVNNVSVAVFKISVSRRPLYHVINLLSPVILLGVLNVFVFLLPVDSGERVGFSVTCFLSYVVLLNIIMVFLPESSLSLSYLSYYTFVMMIFSAGMSLATILTVRISFKSEDNKVPAALRVFISILTCRFKNLIESPVISIKVEPKEDIEPVADSVWDEELPVSKKDKSDDVKSESSDSPKNDEITWKDVSRIMDWFLFLGFLGGQIFYSLAYLVPIFVRA